MKRQASYSVFVVLSILSLAAVPTQAGPIQFADVIVRALIDGQTGRHGVDLQLRFAAQQLQVGQKTSPAAPSVLTGDGPGTSLTSVIVASMQDDDIVEIGEVTGTICDCGDILPALAGGGFPKLPLLALAAIPLAFIDFGGGDNDFVNTVIRPLTVTATTTTPPPPPSPIPEPATMILFGSGLFALGARMSRRRHARRLIEKAEAGKP